MSERQIVFLLLPELIILDLAGPVQVFDAAIQMGAPYKIVFCGSQPTLKSAQGLTIAEIVPPVEVSVDDLVIVPGVHMNALDPQRVEVDSGLKSWLRSAYQAGAQIASVCTGAFALAEAGLLSGRRCTTHWAAIPFLQNLYPEAKVLDAVLFVHDGRITTSAGVASGIDMAFSFLEQDQGAHLTALVARYLLVYLRRDGAHTQTSIYLEYRTHLHTGIHRAQDYLIHRATEQVSLSELASIADLSTRSFTRIFKEATGLTPIQYQQRLRLELAANLIHDPNLSIEQVAAKCGFADARHFRRLWQRQFGSAPSAARRFSEGI